MIIGLTGKKGAGKDTVADYLVEHHGFQKVGFATLLKQSVAALFGISLEQIEKWKNDANVCVTISSRAYIDPGYRDREQIEATMNFRKFLQRYGTEAHREVFHEDFWLTAFWDEYHNEYLRNDNLVIPDVRFENEAQSITGRDGYIWRVIRHIDDLTDEHASEAGLPSRYISHILTNTSTIPYLHKQADNAYLTFAHRS